MLKAFFQFQSSVFEENQVDILYS